MSVEKVFCRDCVFREDTGVWSNGVKKEKEWEYAKPLDSIFECRKYPPATNSGSERYYKRSNTFVQVSGDDWCYSGEGKEDDGQET